MKEVVGGVKFAGGVPGNRQRKVCSRNSTAIVIDLDQLFSSFFDSDANSSGAGIDPVFQ